MVLGQAPRGGDAEAGFADSSRPGERQQAMAGLKFDDLLQIGLSPDQLTEQDRQVAGRRCSRFRIDMRRRS